MYPFYSLNYFFMDFDVKALKAFFTRRRVASGVLILFVLLVGMKLGSLGNGEVGSPYYQTESTSGYYDKDDGGYGEEERYVTNSVPMSMSEFTSQEYASTASDLTVAEPETEQTRIIKTGDLSLTVNSTSDTVSALTTIAETYGGFVQSSGTWLEYDETTSGSVTLRVQAADFEKAMIDIRALAEVIQSESVSGQDVTAEFVDLEAELKTRQAEEAQYLEILESADTVEDMLNVQSYLSDVRSEIESLQGMLKYYEDRTTYSTITISIYEKASIIAPTSDWDPVLQAKEALNDLIIFGQDIVNFVIYFVISDLPQLLVILLFIFVAYRVVRVGYRRFVKKGVKK